MGPTGLVFVSIKTPASQTTQAFQNTCEFRCVCDTSQNGYMWKWDVGMTDAGKVPMSAVGWRVRYPRPSQLNPLHLTQKGDLTCASGSSLPYAVQTRVQPTDPHSPGPHSPLRNTCLLVKAERPLLAGTVTEVPTIEKQEGSSTHHLLAHSRSQ